MDLVFSLAEVGADLNEAVTGAAAGNHFNLLNKLILAGASKQEAIKGVEEGGHLNPENILYFISQLDDVPLRKLLVQLMQKQAVSINSTLLLAQAAKLHQLMREYQFNFNQANAWMQLDLHIWFLQVRRKINLPLEIILHISSFITGLADRDTIKLFEKHILTMPQKLLDATINPPKKSVWFSLFFKKPAQPMEKEAALIKYQNRMLL
jgi:hypothetical protein